MRVNLLKATTVGAIDISSRTKVDLTNRVDTVIGHCQGNDPLHYRRRGRDLSDSDSYRSQVLKIISEMMIDLFVWRAVVCLERLRSFGVHLSGSHAPSFKSQVVKAICARRRELLFMAFRCLMIKDNLEGHLSNSEAVLRGLKLLYQSLSEKQTYTSGAP